MTSLTIALLKGSSEIGIPGSKAHQLERYHATFSKCFKFGFHCRGEPVLDDAIPRL